MEQHSDSPTNSRGGIRLFLPAAVTGGLLLTLLYRLDFEPGSPLTTLLPLLFGVFLIHFWLPGRFGMPFLALASCSGAFFVLGPVNAAGLIVILVAFAVLVRLKIPPGVKVTVAVLFVAALAVARAGLVRVPFVAYAIPLAGSLLMFRAALVLYEHRYSKVKPTFIQDLAYLFLLPNLALPLFPIVDYKTMLRNYSPQDEAAIRKGISRIMLGILQLLAHRFLYMFVIPPLSGIHDASAAALYVTSSYLGILHFTGLMWLAVGYLGLLGFNLPSIFENVFLVDSFGAIWRRINIYWREFLMKLVYYPVYFRLRKKTKRAVLFTALITFSATALLHGWQWFWLTGSMTATVTSLAYWLILGTCISVVLSREETRQPAKETGNARSAARKMLRIMGMFLFMSVTWSLWSSASFGDWFYLLSHFGEGGIVAWIKIVAVALLIFGAGTAAWMISFRVKKRVPGEHHGWLPAIITVVILLPLTIIPLREMLPEKPRGFTEKLALPHLNFDEQNDATENYYDRMLGSDGAGKRPWEITSQGNMARSGLDEACTRREDMVVRELIPSRTTAIGPWTIVTNSFGMRDREYTQEKAPGTFRIAVLGGSYEMGSGVPQDSVFENLLEKMLNDSFPGRRIEILNFAVGGYHLPQQVWVMQQKAAQFRPDLVLCFVHSADARRNGNYLTALIRNGADLLYPELYAVRNEAGAKQGMSTTQLKNRFEPFNARITRWSLRQIEQSCDSAGAQLAVVYLPALQDDQNDVQEYTAPGGYLDGMDCGFFYLENVFEGDAARFRLPADPSHPNGYAHLQVARKLAELLVPVVRKQEEFPAP